MNAYTIITQSQSQQHVQNIIEAQLKITDKTGSAGSQQTVGMH